MVIMLSSYLDQCRHIVESEIHLNYVIIILVILIKLPSLIHVKKEYLGSDVSGKPAIIYWSIVTL